MHGRVALARACSVLACSQSTPGAPPDLAACHALEASLARLSHLLKDQRLLSLGAADPADLIASLFASANASLPFTAIFNPAPGSSPAPHTFRHPIN